MWWRGSGRVDLMTKREERCNGGTSGKDGMNMGAVRVAS